VLNKKECIRCNSSNIIGDPLVTTCLNCKCNSYYGGDKILTTLFTINDEYNVRIDYSENKTYVDKVSNFYVSYCLINKALESNISLEKLKMYLTFS